MFSHLKIMREGRGPSFIRMILLWNPLVAAFFVLIGGLNNIWPRFFISLTISMTVSNTISLLIHFLVWIEAGYFKVQKLPVPAPNKNRIRFMAALGMLPGLYVGFYFAGLISNHFGWDWRPPGHADYASGMITGLAIFSIFILADLWNGAKRAKQAAELQIKKLENERLQAQLSALTAQMNPHLLFNALNTIASMIPTDPAGAEEVTVKLSELYRGVLDSSRRITHSLDAELKICENYLSIERFRFGERLKVKLEIDPALDLSGHQIPALLLQPLVENAVKHGIAPKALGGFVNLSLQQKNGENGTQTKLWISIEDDGVGFGNSTAKSGAQSGLQNCKARIELKYGSEGSFQIIARPEGGTKVEIFLPIEKTENKS